jgi:hypothetical protein
MFWSEMRAHLAPSATAPAYRAIPTRPHRSSGAAPSATCASSGSFRGVRDVPDLLPAGYGNWWLFSAIPPRDAGRDSPGRRDCMDAVVWVILGVVLLALIVVVGFSLVRSASRELRPARCRRFRRPPDGGRELPRGLRDLRAQRQWPGLDGGPAPGDGALSRALRVLVGNGQQADTRCQVHQGDATRFEETGRMRC